MNPPRGLGPAFLIDTATRPDRLGHLTSSRGRPLFCSRRSVPTPTARPAATGAQRGIGDQLMADRIPMTRAGYVKLEADLKQLKSVERPKIVREIEAARAHGDISENAEFHAAKERQSHIETRIRQLEDQLADRKSVV